MRRRILTPDDSETSLARRGFHERDAESRDLLEKVGRTFLAGFGYAVQARDPLDAEQRLEGVERDFRGFAYEGAAMGLAILDGLGVTRGRRVDRFLSGRAGDHVYMVYIGVGWALARLPRFRWRAVLPGDPLLRWLALDGYGFHQAYFHTDRYVRRRHRDTVPAWPVEPGRAYAVHAVDQGIGRALWFVEGTAVDRIVATIEGFPAHRREDLYSGAGLAATYAGGVSDADLATFWRLAGDHRPAVAQAAAFAATARLRAGLVTPHTGRATAAFCGASPEQVAAVTEKALRDLPGDGPEPAFAVWRRRIANEFVSLGRC
ncbi:DUF1702 family protein [Phytohabitans suffuscus]|uniref:Enediyne biosynthesis protein n=1 Tax=Phytohabitans suffuscus TaxID=624315 RepID=A0A6F8YQY0_9ACTN|nr:enediyne biosynthesis protein [Phytohabitans suffuscus]